MKLFSTLNVVETIKLLKRLRSVKAQYQYPPDLLSARRAEFLGQASAAGLNIEGSKSGAQIQSGSVHFVEKILQYVLAGMVTVLSVTAAYTYREDIRNFFLPDQNDMQIVETPLEVSLPLPSEPAPTPTITLPPTETPALILSTPELKPKPINTSTPPNPKPISTSTPPNPKPISTSTPPGLHLGQTKTPKPK